MENEQVFEPQISQLIKKMRKTNTPTIILRSPTKDEILASGLEPSDSQIAQVRILSKVLYDFGLVSKIYRSKSTVIAKDNRKEMKKNLGIFSTFLGTFNETESIETVRKVLGLSKVSQFTENDYLTVIANTVNLLSKDNLLDNLSIVYKNVYHIGNEPTEVDVQRLSGIYHIFSDIIKDAKENGHTTAKLKKRISYAHHVNEVMKQEWMSDAIQMVYVDKAIHTVQELGEDIESYIHKHTTEGAKQHSNTVIHNEAKKAQDKLEVSIKNAGFKGGLTPGNVFAYFKTYDTERISYISRTYDISLDELDGEHFKDWEDVASFFYSPVNLFYIDTDLLGTQNRARAIGDIRRSLTTRDLLTVQQRKTNLENKIKGKSDPENYKKRIQSLEDKLREKESEYDQAISWRNKVQKDLANTKDEKLIAQLSAALKQAKELVVKIGRSTAQVRHTLKVTKENKNDSVKQSDMEKLRELELQERELLDKAKNNLADNVDIREFERTFEVNKINPDLYNFDKEINYRTFSFIVNTIDNKILAYIVNQLHSGFSMVSNEKNDEYFNIDVCAPEEAEFASGYSQIFLDYPAESKIFGLFKKNAHLGNELVDSLERGVKQKFGVNMRVVKDEDHLKVNAPF